MVDFYIMNNHILLTVEIQDEIMELSLHFILKDPIKFQLQWKVRILHLPLSFSYNDSSFTLLQHSGSRVVVQIIRIYEQVKLSE